MRTNRPNRCAQIIDLIDRCLAEYEATTNPRPLAADVEEPAAAA